MKTGLRHTKTTAMLYARVHPSVNVLLFLACACACAGEEGEKQQQPPETTPTTTRNASVLRNLDTAFWTTGLTAKPGAAMSTVTEVRTWPHDEFERIVFTFEPDVSGYHVEYVDRPVRQCGSGEVVELPGDAWLSIKLEPAQAHTEEGRPTIEERTRDLDYDNIKRIKLICDFEGQVEWIVAVTSPTRYRTLELRDPSRLVVDVKK